MVEGSSPSSGTRDVSSVVERSIAVRMVTRSIRVRRLVAWRSWLTRDVYTVKIAGSNPAVTSYLLRSGAAEACWAHNPEVPRSKLGFAINIFLTHVTWGVTRDPDEFSLSTSNQQDNGSAR